MTTPEEMLLGLRYHATRKLALVYSHAPEQGPHKPLSYSVATRETPVVTRLPDGVETKNTAKVGDLIFTGIGGERYVIRAAKFPSLYVGDIGGPLSVIPTTRMVARYTGSKTITFKAPWGEDMVLKNGDYVVREQDGKGHYRIARVEFERTYLPIPKG